MKVIGLTGNIGCGKSTVAAMLGDLGAAHIDADAISREIRRDDEGARAEILRRFGTLDATDLARTVFNDAAALRDLEAIIHPRVRDLVRERLAALVAAGSPAAVIEAIKLLESPLHDVCDATWVVICSESDAIARLTTARGLSEAAARSRMANQSPQAAKVAAADVVIDGSASLEKTREQVVAAFQALMAG